MKYSPSRERVLLSELDAARRPKRTRTCATDKQKYEKLRLNPCVEYFEIEEDALPIRSSADADALVHDTFDVGSSVQEVLWVICLNNRNQPVGVAEMFRGSRNEASIDRALILQAALLVGAVGFIIAHNHPSATTLPSDADIALTSAIKQAANHVGLRLLDHIIVMHKQGKYFSFLDQGMLGA